MGRGVNQGDSVPPTMFNIIVDAAVRETLQEICGPQEAQHGFGWLAEEHDISFYADDGWMQLLAGIFHEPLFQVFLDVRKAYN